MFIHAHIDLLSSFIGGSFRCFIRRMTLIIILNCKYLFSVTKGGVPYDLTNQSPYPRRIQ
jgi:hypothetical protein